MLATDSGEKVFCCSCGREVAAGDSSRVECEDDDGMECIFHYRCWLNIILKEDYVQ